MIFTVRFFAEYMPLDLHQNLVSNRATFCLTAAKMG